jgi:hypothetical protein
MAQGAQVIVIDTPPTPTAPRTPQSKPPTWC